MLKKNLNILSYILIKHKNRCYHIFFCAYNVPHEFNTFGEGPKKEEFTLEDQ